MKPPPIPTLSDPDFCSDFCRPPWFMEKDAGAVRPAPFHRVNSSAVCDRLLNVQQFNIKYQRRIRRNVRRSSRRPISELSGNNEVALTADLHGHQTFVPTFNDPPYADLKVSGMTAAIRAIKLYSALQLAGVVDCNRLAPLRRSPGALDQIRVLQSARRGYFLSLTTAAVHHQICNGCCHQGSNKKDRNPFYTTLVFRGRASASSVCAHPPGTLFRFSSFSVTTLRQCFLSWLRLIFETLLIQCFRSCLQPSALASPQSVCYSLARITSDPKGSGNRAGDGARDS